VLIGFDGLVAAPDVVVATEDVNTVVVAFADVLVTADETAGVVGSVDAPALVGIGADDGTGVATVSAAVGVPVSAG